MSLSMIQTADMIEKCIDAIKKEGKLSAGMVEKKARAMAEYDKRKGMAVASLRAADKPVSIVSDLAKKEVSDALYQKILAEETLKAHYCRMENLRAQLNGLQSINRYLSQT